ncbi:hypothetical protein FRACA_1270009 [Frankia canadensis]|uniref:Uncharacterized protein n=1 Tax=Frankia canadensis TaxID=1836972 RepID=A0A2I2KKE1_9ACTN|nr:hypothetical protein FRACA_1270009 [Frankia canadensis]SOU53415.1 hypothetical protein FRACA_1270009 [Frankia canadensis]
MFGTIDSGGGVARAATGWGMDTAPRYRSPNNALRAGPGRKHDTTRPAEQ